MLKAEQVPKEVIAAWHRHCADNLATTYEEAFAAAINAWSGMFSAIRTEEGGVEWDNEGNAPECLVLPLPQESTNAEG